MRNDLPPPLRPDDRAKRLLEIVRKTNSPWGRISDRIFTAVWMGTLGIALIILGQKLYGSLRSSQFVLLGGPTEGEYMTLATQMQRQFNEEGKWVDRPSNLGEAFGQALHPERSLTMGYRVPPGMPVPHGTMARAHRAGKPVATSGSAENVGLLLASEFYLNDGRVSDGNAKGSFKVDAHDTPVVGFCQDGVFPDPGNPGGKDHTNRLRALAPAYISDLYIFVRAGDFGKEPQFGDLLHRARWHLDPLSMKRVYDDIRFSSEASNDTFQTVAQEYGVPVGDAPQYLASDTDTTRSPKAILSTIASKSRQKGEPLAFVALLGPDSSLLRPSDEGDPFPDPLDRVYPVRPLNLILRPSSRQLPPGLDLVGIDRADVVATRSYGYIPASVPKGFLLAMSQEPVPQAPVPTIGVREILACNADLSDRDAYDIVRRLCQLPQLKSWLTSLNDAWTVTENSTYIPLHPGALRFYRKEDLPPAFDQTVFGLLITAAGAYFGKLKRHRIRQQLGDIEGIIGTLAPMPAAGPRGMAKVKRWVRIARVWMRHPRMRRKPSIDLQTIRYEAFVKLKLGLIDESHYSCVDKYCSFVESLREYEFGNPTITLSELKAGIERSEQEERDHALLESLRESGLPANTSVGQLIKQLEAQEAEQKDGRAPLL